MKGSKTPKSSETTHNSLSNLSLLSSSENVKSTKGIRKRKDRSHSVSNKDKKVVRSNSEERIIKKNVCNKSMRRVSSHEDFKKYSDENNSNLSCKEQQNAVKNEVHADEYEWRRKGERQFRLPLHRRKHNYFKKSAKIRQVAVFKHEEKEKCQYLNNNNDEDDPIKTKQSLLKPNNANSDKHEKTSPYSSPSSSVLDLSTLHQQIDSLEPIPSSTSQQIAETLPSTSISCNKLFNSPRNSLISTERIYLDHYVAQSKGSPLKGVLNPIEKRLNNLNKQIKRNKKKIRQYELDFEQKKGYKPSEMDKISDPFINGIICELNKLKKEYKQAKKLDSKVVVVQSQVVTSSLENSEGESVGVLATLAETLQDIEQKVSNKRALANRPFPLEEMTNTQLLEEKVDIQKGLLYLQTKHGRPNNKEDKDLVRALYDRYRNVKRMVARTVPSSNIIELATIHEHEALTITQNESRSSTPSTDNQETNASANANLNQDQETLEKSAIESNLHSLSLPELIEEKKSTVEEKKRLQKTLKDFENAFKGQIGRKIKRDDKEPMLPTYESYKKAKAKLKLLEALLQKLTSVKEPLL